jgi:hypothetical protein
MSVTKRITIARCKMSDRRPTLGEPLAQTIRTDPFWYFHTIATSAGDVRETCNIAMQWIR